MKTSDFSFDLPEELIAQTPLERRDASRLLVLDKTTGQTKHRHFYDIAQELSPGDLLVLNDSRVIPARLFGRGRAGPGRSGISAAARARALPVGDHGAPREKARPGTVFSFGEGLTGEVLDTLEGGLRLVRFQCEGNFFEVLDKIGQMPCRPTFMSLCAKTNAIRRSMPSTGAPPPRRRPACILRRSCSKRCSKRVSALPE